MWNISSGRISNGADLIAERDEGVEQLLRDLNDLRNLQIEFMDRVTQDIQLVDNIETNISQANSNVDFAAKEISEVRRVTAKSRKRTAIGVTIATIGAAISMVIVGMKLR